MAYLKATVKETLRLHPPGPLLIPHLSMADCEIDGYTIPAGTRIMVNVWALARDPASWETPEEFAPERFLPGGSAAAHNGTGKEFDFLPFGSGRRICPGINFANAAVEMMLANLVYHFDWELPTETKEVDMKEVFSLSIRRKEKLHLVPLPRTLSYKKDIGRVQSS
jgi:cytochrome P450